MIVMNSIEKIVVVTRLPGVEMGWKNYQRQSPFQVAYIHLLFDIWPLTRLPGRV